MFPGLARRRECRERGQGGDVAEKLDVSLEVKAEEFDADPFENDLHFLALEARKRSAPSFQLGLACVEFVRSGWQSCTPSGEWLRRFP